MAENMTPPRTEDIASVGSRISWGAILAGGMVALALEFLLAVLGGAVGISVSDRANPGTVRIAALIWSIVITCAAVFVGGMVTSQFTVGENKMEAVLYGIIMWALLVAVTLGLVGAGVRGMSSALVGMSDVAYRTNAGWEEAALAAGVPKEQVTAWRQRILETHEKTSEGGASRTSISSESATTIAWCVFGGTWISMFMAAAGAWVGAGPTFRLVAAESTRMMVSS